MKGNELFFTIVIAFITAVMTWLATYNITNARWEIDCQKLGKTVTNGTVYECAAIQKLKVE